MPYFAQFVVTARDIPDSERVFLPEFDARKGFLHREAVDHEACADRVAVERRHEFCRGRPVVGLDKTVKLIVAERLFRYIEITLAALIK